jgi:hypothetical protein
LRLCCGGLVSTQNGVSQNKRSTIALEAAYESSGSDLRDTIRAFSYNPRAT